MSGPVVPPGREELREALIQALPESLGPISFRRPSVPLLNVEASTTGYGDILADALLPTVLAAIEEQGRRRAVEELRAAAEWAFDRNDGYGSYSAVINELDRRADALHAAALAPENARPE